MAAKELTVKELKEILSNLPDDTVVVLSGDVEGNEFSPLGAYSLGTYTLGRKPWEKGDFFDGDDSASDNGRAKKALALWPMH